MSSKLLTLLKEYKPTAEYLKQVVELLISDTDTGHNFEYGWRIERMMKHPKADAVDTLQYILEYMPVVLIFTYIRKFMPDIHDLIDKVKPKDPVSKLEQIPLIGPISSRLYPGFGLDTNIMQRLLFYFRMCQIENLNLMTMFRGFRKTFPDTEIDSSYCELIANSSVDYDIIISTLIQCAKESKFSSDYNESVITVLIEYFIWCRPFDFKDKIALDRLTTFTRIIIENFGIDPAWVSSGDIVDICALGYKMSKLKYKKCGWILQLCKILISAQEYKQEDFARYVNIVYCIDEKVMKLVTSGDILTMRECLKKHGISEKFSDQLIENINGLED